MRHRAPSFLCPAIPLLPQLRGRIVGERHTLPERRLKGLGGALELEAVGIDNLGEIIDRYERMHVIWHLAAFDLSRGPANPRCEDQA